MNISLLPENKMKSSIDIKKLNLSNCRWTVKDNETCKFDFEFMIHTLKYVVILTNVGVKDTNRNLEVLTYVFFKHFY